MSSGHRHRGVSLGDHEVDQALAHPEVRRRLARTPRVDRSWDIPYLGGYSEDGRTIFLDRHLPRGFAYRGRQVDLDRFLILHEEVEKALIDELYFKYAHAHEVATRAEENAVRAAGINVPWYRKTLAPMIKADALERLLRVPGKLSMKPYKAPPVNESLMRRIGHAQRHPAPPGKVKPAEAQYGPGHAQSRCGLCAYFTAPRSCTVLPHAKPDMWCTFFVKAYQPEEKSNAA
jgi:hypothetical protein